MATFNSKKFNKDIFKALDKNKGIKEQAYRIVRKKVDIARRQLVEEFDNHPVTQEILAGKTASNTSGTLANFLSSSHYDVYQQIKDKTVFDIMEDNIVIAKNNDGLALMPNYSFNGIGDFIPGEGYQIKMRKAFNNAQFF